MEDRLFANKVFLTFRGLVAINFIFNIAFAADMGGDAPNGYVAGRKFHG